MVVVALAGIASAAGWVGIEGDDDPWLAVLTIAFEVYFAGVVLLLARRRGISLADLGFVRPAGWGLVPVAVVGGYFALFCYGVALVLLENLGVDVSGLGEGNPLPVDAEAHWSTWALYGVAAVGVAPVAEEIFFRGLVFRVVAGRWPVGVAYVVSGLCFGAFNVNPSVLVPFSLIGIVFAWSYWKSGSLWTTIAAHFVFNGLALIVAIAGGSST